MKVLASNRWQHRRCPPYFNPHHNFLSAYSLVATVGVITTPLCAAALLGPGPSGSHRPPAPLSAPPGWFSGPPQLRNTMLGQMRPVLVQFPCSASASRPAISISVPAWCSCPSPVWGGSPSRPCHTATCPCATQDCPLLYAAVVGPEGAAPTSQAGVPATLQDVVQLLLEIRADRALRPSQCPNLCARTSPRVCRSPPGLNQCLLRSSLPQITSLRVRQPARGPSQCLSRYILRPSLPLIPSPRVSRLVLGPVESNHRSQYSHLSRRPWPSPCLCQAARLCEADLVLNCNDMDMDEEEREPRAPWTVDQLRAKIAAVTKGVA
ncbi:hypothetical protein E2C01_083027 [Portunus trituberculatus]|uniref:Uncharacterized protein n=1 Tax=Portunus trituberculatus TaxID=210409 RepID=A0A5B7J6P5_PORTR|nr:hypothetical protein [Portunus trituberculatus]